MKVIASMSETDRQVRLDYTDKMAKSKQVKEIIAIIRTLPDVREWEYDPY